jgi:hypothetical protein
MGAKMKSVHSVLAFLLAAACGPSTALPAVFADPAGDTFGPPGVHHDITSVSASANGTTLTFTVSFAGPISAPSSSAANSVVAFIDLDTDQNAATGGTGSFGGPVVGGNSEINFLIGIPLVPGPTVLLGDEYYVDLLFEQNHPGLADIVRTSDNTSVGTIPIAYAASAFTVAIPLSSIGNDNGLVNFAVVVGTINDPTDRAPGGDQPLASTIEQSVIPEPASLTIWSLAALTLGLAHRRRRALFSSPRLCASV